MCVMVQDSCLFQVYELHLFYTARSSAPNETELENFAKTGSFTSL
jgi:hypothetical protein